MDTEIRERIKAIIVQNTPDYLMRYKELFSMINNESEIHIPEILEFVFQCYLESDQMDDELKKIVSDTNWQSCRRITAQIIAHLSKQNNPKEVFYRDLWLMLLSPCYANDDERSFALLAMCRNIRLPYHYLGEGCKLTDEEYHHVTLKNIDKVVHGCQIVINREGKQKTEIASLILELLDTLEDKLDRTVVLAQIIGIILDRDEQQ